MHEWEFRTFTHGVTVGELTSPALLRGSELLASARGRPYFEDELSGLATAASRSRVAVHNTKLVRRWLPAVPGRVLHSGRRVVQRLARDMLWASTFIAVYQRLRLFTSSA